MTKTKWKSGNNKCYKPRVANTEEIQKKARFGTGLCVRFGNELWFISGRKEIRKEEMGSYIGKQRIEICQDHSWDKKKKTSKWNQLGGADFCR